MNNRHQLSKRHLSSNTNSNTWNKVILSDTAQFLNYHLPDWRKNIVVANIQVPRTIHKTRINSSRMFADRFSGHLYGEGSTSGSTGGMSASGPFITPPFTTPFSLHLFHHTPSPCERNDWQTGVKTLPCPKLCLRAVIKISYTIYTWCCLLPNRINFWLKTF